MPVVNFAVEHPLWTLALCGILIVNGWNVVQADRLIRRLRQDQPIGQLIQFPGADR